MDRRTFIKKAGTGMVLATTGGFPLEALASGEVHKLTILHTNDVHSRIEPFPMDGSRYEGMAGVEPRARLIRKIRETEKNVLLVDAGDIFQGTPYFNLFNGELEMRLMSRLGYEASVPGNHEFDKGIENLALQLQHADFPLVISNYGIENTPLQGKMPPRHIIRKGPFKIGIVGAGIRLDKGLSIPSLYGDIVFLPTVPELDKQAAILKFDEKCDLIICLSHLGFKYKEEDMESDHTVAAQSKYIDIIIGGHTHTFLERPAIVSNVLGNPVVINQAGWSGVMLGRLDVSMESNRKNKCITCRNEWVKA